VFSVGCRVYSVRCRVQGVGCRVQGVGCRLSISFRRRPGKVLGQDHAEHHKNSSISVASDSPEYTPPIGDKYTLLYLDSDKSQPRPFLLFVSAFLQHVCLVDFFQYHISWQLNARPQNLSAITYDPKQRERPTLF
jgi:hypothetical protein